MRRVAMILFASGCDLIFPLVEPGDPVAPVPDGSVVPGGVLTPPNTGSDCGSPPAFESWQFSAAVFPFDGPSTVSQFSFYRTGTELRAIATTGAEMFDVAEDGTATPLTSLTAPQGSMISMPRVTYDGVAMWFQQTGASEAVFLAARATGWTKQRADLGFVNAARIEPGAIAYFASSARMVVAVVGASGPSELHELSSLDGEHWTELDTIEFPGSGLGDHHPTLAPDGCYLIYTASNGTNELRIAHRNADGKFTSASRLDTPSDLTSAPSFPVLTPDQDTFWFTAVVGTSTERFRGQE